MSALRDLRVCRLMYWVIFAFLSLMETFSAVILTWFPLYYALKLAFLVFLFLPQTKGAEFIYSNFLGPSLRSRFGAGAASNGAGAASLPLNKAA